MVKNKDKLGTVLHSYITLPFLFPCVKYIILIKRCTTYTCFLLLHDNYTQFARHPAKSPLHRRPSSRNAKVWFPSWILSLSRREDVTRLRSLRRNNLSNLSRRQAARPWLGLIKRHEIPLRNMLTIYPAHCIPS